MEDIVKLLLDFILTVGCRGEAVEIVVACREEDGVCIPVPGGIVDEEDETDVPGGTPVIIEDFFKDRFMTAANQPRPKVDKCADDTGINFWYNSNQTGLCSLLPFLGSRIMITLADSTISMAMWRQFYSLDDCCRSSSPSSWYLAHRALGVTL